MADLLAKRSVDELDTVEQHGGSSAKKLCIDPQQEQAATKESAERLFLAEKTVGITEFISGIPGFSAVIKERYSDFLVNEIDLDGNVVRLSNFDVPQYENESQATLNELTSIIGQAAVKHIEDLYNGISVEPVTLDASSKDKEARTKIHEGIRVHFNSLDSTTITLAASRLIIVSKVKSTRRRYPPGIGDFTRFVLYKENKDTMDAIQFLATKLRVSTGLFSFAGTKDKRAKSSQLVSAYKVMPEKLLRFNRISAVVKVGNIMHKDMPLNLGDLSGNRFVIILRQVEGDPSIIAEAMMSLSTRGFINYYGMQRFGTRTIPTHAIGRALIQGKWKEATELILHGKVDNEGLATARKMWKEKCNAKKLFAQLKLPIDSIEGHLVLGLVTHAENDLINALNAVPRNTRLLYLHSYQSYIWNKVVSRRIKSYGLKVLVGDLIASSDKGLDADAADGMENMQVAKVTPKRATAEDLHNEDCIYNVVMPLPGHNVVYPDNETKNWYEEFLKEDDLDFDSFLTKVKSYSLSGTYRKTVVKPSEVKWELLQYNDVSQPLALSDLDVLQGVEIPISMEEAELTALKIELSLPSSSYATMAVREILKADTTYPIQKIVKDKP